MNVDQAVDQFPVLTEQPADLPLYNNSIPIQKWRGAGPANGVIPTTGKVFCPILAADGSLTSVNYPAIQYYGANVPPVDLPPGTPPNTAGINAPPVDVAKYNALAAENEQIVATPFGLTLQQIAPPAPAPPAPSPTDTPLAQQTFSLLSRLAKNFGVS